MRLLRKILFLLLFISPLFGSTQVTVNQDKVDFGEIVRGSNRVVDLILSNSGDNETRMLRNTFGFEYDILLESTTILAHGSTTLRVKFNPRSQGHRKEKIELWFSSMNKPLVLTFSAEVMYVDNSENPACPDFNQKPADCCPENDCLVKILDAESGLPLQNARLRLVEDGRVQLSVKSNRDGEVLLQVPIAYYLMVADREGYFPNDTANYINRRNHYFEIFLQPEEEALVAEIPEPLSPEKVPETPETPIPSTPIPPDEPVEDQSVELPESKFAENNLVLLVDVSHSMGQQGKMELLQASMLEMTDVLREVDRIALITYAARPDLVLKSTPGGKSDEIHDIITGLEAGGMTQGALGFKKAYEVALKNYIEGGNNEVIVCTDGAFRAEDVPKILKLVKKYEKKGIRTTVVGIRSKKHASEKLGEISQLGNGNFIFMEEFDHSRRQLIDEVKEQSRK